MARLPTPWLRGGPPRGEWLSGLQRRISEAALALGGFDHVSWNERIEVLPGRGGSADHPIAVAGWDGTLLYRQDVIAPLRHLHKHWGRPHPPPVLRLYKQALATMVHETYHLVAPAEHEHQEGRAGFEDPSSRMLEEGVTELYTHLRLDDVIRAADLDRGAPGICDVRLAMAYPEFVPGTKRLVEWAASATQLGYQDLLGELAGQTAAGKYPYLAEIILINTGLSSVIPPTRQPACRRELEHGVRSILDEAGSFPQRVPRAVYEALSDDLGIRACDALHNAVAGLDTRYRHGVGRGGRDVVSPCFPAREASPGRGAESGRRPGALEGARRVDTMEVER